jgi:hypothetical protein
MEAQKELAFHRLHSIAIYDVGFRHIEIPLKCKGSNGGDSKRPKDWHGQWQPSSHYPLGTAMLEIKGQADVGRDM